MISKRLGAIISLINNGSSVIDIGTDHAYIPIYLVENNISINVLATDISKKVIINSYNNIKKHHLEDKIKLKVTDGFNDIEEKYDVAILAGMGFFTIKEILDKSLNIPDTLIIASNNKLELLRDYMQKKGYKIEKEVVVLERKYYNIIKYIKGYETLKEEELLFGKVNDLAYFKSLYNKYEKLWFKSNKEQYKKYLTILKSIIERKQD